VELDGLRWTLIHAGPTLDAILGTNGIRFVKLDLINLTGTDLNAVSTTPTFLLVHNRIHMVLKDINRLALCHKLKPGWVYFRFDRW
jgi:hypothetical protein